MFEFVTRWLVCLVLLAVVVQSERTIKDTAGNACLAVRQRVSGRLYGSCNGV